MKLHEIKVGMKVRLKNKSMRAEFREAGNGRFKKHVYGIVTDVYRHGGLWPVRVNVIGLPLARGGDTPLAPHEIVEVKRYGR